MRKYTIKGIEGNMIRQLFCMLLCCCSHNTKQKQPKQTKPLPTSSPNAPKQTKPLPTSNTPNTPKQITKAIAENNATALKALFTSQKNISIDFDYFNLAIEHAAGDCLSILVDFCLNRDRCEVMDGMAACWMPALFFSSSWAIKKRKHVDLFLNSLNQVLTHPNGDRHQRCISLENLFTNSSIDIELYSKVLIILAPWLTIYKDEEKAKLFENYIFRFCMSKENLSIGKTVLLMLANHEHFKAVLTDDLKLKFLTESIRNSFNAYGPAMVLECFFHKNTSKLPVNEQEKLLALCSMSDDYTEEYIARFDSSLQDRFRKENEKRKEINKKSTDIINLLKQYKLIDKGTIEAYQVKRAAESRDFQLIESLLKFSVDENHLDKTLFYFAIERNDTRLFDFWFNRMVPWVVPLYINKAESGRKPLHRVVSNGNIDILRKLLHFGHLEVNAQDHDGSTPLDIAKRLGHKSVIDALLARGAVHQQEK